MKKLALLLSLFVMASVGARDYFLIVPLEGRQIFFKKTGRIVEMINAGGTVICKRVISDEKKGNFISELLRAFKAKLTSSEIKEIEGMELVYRDGLEVALEKVNGVAKITPLNASNLSTNPPAPRGNSTHSTVWSKIKQSAVNAKAYVVGNAQQYPVQTVVAVVVGGGLGFKAGDMLAKKFELQKKYAYVMQAVTTISGATFATVGTWMLLNKYYKA